MSDKYRPDTDFDADATRPSKPYRSTGDDETKPIRPPGDPENTIISTNRPRPQPQPARPPQPGRPAQPQPPAGYSSPGQRPAQSSPPARPPQPPRPGPPPVTPAHKTTAPSQQPLSYHYRSRRETQQPHPSAYQQTRVSQSPPPRPSWGRRLVRLTAVLSLVLILFTVLALAGGVVTYVWIATQLPPAEELRSRSFHFATSQILDREGNLLWEIIDPTGGRRTSVSLDQISPHLINATIATEDRFFYLNVGVDPIAIARAVYYNLTEGEVVSGGSTITQQLARGVLLTPEERIEQSFTRKIREAVLAVEINRRYTKTQILEIYLNQIYYGNLAYGIEAASQTYFGKHANELTLTEASLLAGLPQSPAIHDPYVNPEGALARQADVLRLMVEADYISSTEAEAAKFEDLSSLKPLSSAFAAPHFISYVRQELEKVIPPEYIYQAGLRVQTTLDPRLQAIAEEEVRNQVNALRDRNVTNGALVAMDVKTGQVLALVGSEDFRDEVDGQINMAIAPRQPGSTIKPLTYLAAFERLNWTPSTLIMDTPVKYPDGAGGFYEPNNYDNKFHGPVSLRIALANSYNIPPIKTLELIGIEALKEMASRLGITTLTRNDYGLSLTLGSGEISLVEMTGAYQAIANQGVLVAPTAILQITDNFGQVIEPPRPQPRRAIREEHAYLMTHILADNEARSLSVGPNSYLRLSRPVAAKTGTTNDFRDNWTVGYTPDIAAGVWVGNADRTPMINISGLSGAGPIWHNFMERAHEGVPIKDFTRPAAIIELEVCADSGTIPSEVCPQRRKEIFFQEQPPLGPEHDIHQIIEIDRNTGLRANEFCRNNIEKKYYQVYPPDGWAWAVEHGIEQPPADYCPSTNIMANISLPLDGSTVRGMTSLEGSAMAANFSHYQIEFGVGTDPQAFAVIQSPLPQSVEEGILGTFDTTQVENGPYTLRLVVFDQSGGAVEARVRVLVDNPPTPTPTSTPIEPSPTPTDTPTLEPTVTETPTLIPTSPLVETPTETPTSTLTPVPELPTETPTIPPVSPTTPPTTEPTAEPTSGSLEATIEPPTP